MSSISEPKRPLGRVLLVDDDRAIRTSLSAILKEEFTVRAVESPAVGRALISIEHFDVVVTDFDMPAQDGISFLDYLDKHHPATVGILLTGRIAHAKVNNAQKDWARYRVLLKPVDPIALIATIRTSLHIARLRQSTGRLSTRLNR
jgi:DNA-binding NtrC family response regulator